MKDPERVRSSCYSYRKKKSGESADAIRRARDGDEMCSDAPPVFVCDATEGEGVGAKFGAFGPEPKLDWAGGTLDGAAPATDIPSTVELSFCEFWYHELPSASATVKICHPLLFMSG